MAYKNYMKNVTLRLQNMNMWHCRVAVRADGWTTVVLEVGRIDIPYAEGLSGGEKYERAFLLANKYMYKYSVDPELHEKWLSAY